MATGSSRERTARGLRAVRTWRSEVRFRRACERAPRSDGRRGPSHALMAAGGGAPRGRLVDRLCIRQGPGGSFRVALRVAGVARCAASAETGGAERSGVQCFVLRAGP